MGLAPEAGTRFAPRRVDGVDIAALPLTPLEAFVLSQLDGATDLDEVSVVTSLNSAQVELIVRRLTEMGVVHPGVSRPSRMAPGAGRPVPRRDPRRDDDSTGPIEDTVHAPRVQRPATRSNTPDKIAPNTVTSAGKPAAVEVEIDAERRALIDATHSRLDSLSHYQLLDVPPRASKKEIKDAYFSIISNFHPDRYFSKHLGNYKKKVDQVFERLTQAYEVLSRKASREEYDRYMKVRRVTRSFDAVVTSMLPPRPSKPAPSVTEQISAAPSSDQAPVGAAAPPRDCVDTRQERELGAAPLAADPQATAIPESALDSPRDLASSRREMARLEQAQRFRAAGVESQRDGQYVSAVNALRIAGSIAPEDTEIARLLEQAEQTAARELAETYQTRAQYEEQNKEFLAAAQSYERVAAGRPSDPRPLVHAARCLLRAGTDPKRAAGLARRAVALAPEITEHRVTLAEAYETAGLLQSALAELERARALAPKDEAIAATLKRVKKLCS